jgi:hypothetical protein
MAYSPFSLLSGSMPDAPHAAQFESQTANLFLRDAASEAIRKVAAYVETNSARFPPLAAIAPVISQAADAFRNREYGSALAHAYTAYRQIVMVRGAVPDLPNPD